MKNMTFREYLMEIDVGDLQFARDSQKERYKQTQDYSARNDFKNEMSSNSPNRNDIIVDEYGQQFVVQKMSMDGIMVKQLAGKSTATFPHDTKYKSMGKTKGGRPSFKIVK